MTLVAGQCRERCGDRSRQHHHTLLLCSFPSGAFIAATRSIWSREWWCRWWVIGRTAAFASWEDIANIYRWCVVACVISQKVLWTLINLIDNNYNYGWWIVSYRKHTSKRIWKYWWYIANNLGILIVWLSAFSQGGLISQSKFSTFWIMIWSWHSSDVAC